MPFGCVSGGICTSGNSSSLMEPDSYHAQKYLAGLLLSSTQLHSSEEFTAPEDTIIIKSETCKYQLDKILLRYSRTWSL